MVQVRSSTSRIKQVGIAGTGFTSRGLVRALKRSSDYSISHVLTRRNLDNCGEFPSPDLLTRSISQLVDQSDLIIECSGDPIHAAEVINSAMKNGLPVITMNAEFQVTCGSWFVDKGFLTESHGDQHGSLATLNEEVRLMGFDPLVYGNRKGFLNPNPDISTMQHWSEHHGISLEQVIAATDGTKIQIEQVLVANGLGANIAIPGMLGLEEENLESGALKLADYSARENKIIADYVLSPNSDAAYFIVAKHDKEEKECLKYFRLGDGPYYLLQSNYHLCHLEIIRTIERVKLQNKILLNNSSKPEWAVAAITKRRLKAGEVIKRGIGSFEVRGKSISIEEDFVPIGLLSNARVVRQVNEGQQLTFDDVEIPDTLALSAWQDIKKRNITSN